MILHPNSKINFGLNIVSKRPDGYHNLETVFYPIGLHDELEITPAEGTAPHCELTIEGIEIAGSTSDNLIVRAYNLLAEQYPQLPPVRVRLNKMVPTGAGLGGGSSDAAFMLKGMNDLAGLNLTDETLEAYAARLGADCAFFIKGAPTFATGIGNEFHPISITPLQGKTLMLIKPDVFVSTKDAYSLVHPEIPQHSLAELLCEPLSIWQQNVVNDFERSVFPKFPQIAEVKQVLLDLGATYAAMSGSGASVFAIFDKEPIIHEEQFKDMFMYKEKL